MADTPRIDVSPDGPYLVRGGVELRQGSGTLPPRDVAALCRCGASASKPYCDGSHRRIGFGGAAAAPPPGGRKVRDYAAPGVTVRDRRWLCMHAAECIHGLPAVFRKNERPWIAAFAASPEELRAVVRRCPSGALSTSTNGIEDAEPEHGPPVIDIEKNGPLRVTGALPLHDPSGVAPAVAGRYTLCRCGRSAQKPFCDGSHAGGFDDGTS